MKALRNPYVMSALVVLAVVLGYYRFRAPRVVAAPKAEEKPQRPQIAGPDASVELDKLGWTPSPTRDPFGGAAPVQVTPTISDEKTEPVAAEVLDLKAVWLQEGGGLAVINGKVLGEGDAILEFRVEKILADGVLVQGPDGRRQVGFKPASAKPRPSPAAAPSPLAQAPPTPTPGNPVTIPGVPAKLVPAAPLTMEDVTKAVGQVFGPGSTAAISRLKIPEKSAP